MIVGQWVLCAANVERGLFRWDQTSGDRGRHGAGNIILNGQKVAVGAVVTISPHAISGRGPDELHRYAQPSAGAPHAAIEEMRRAHRSPELGRTALRTPIPLHRRARLDH